MRIRDTEEGGGYIVKNDTNLKIPLLSRLEPLNIETEAKLGSNYSLTIKTPSQNVTKEITRDKEIINPLFSPISLNYIPLRKEVFYTFYDPVLNRKTNVLLLNRGRMDIELDGQIMESYKVEMDVEGIKGVIFVDNHGRLLKEGFLGFSFVKEDTRKLFKHDYFTAGKDFITHFFLPAPETVESIQIVSATLQLSV